MIKQLATAVGYCEVDTQSDVSAILRVRHREGMKIQLLAHTLDNIEPNYTKTIISHCYSFPPQALS